MLNINIDPVKSKIYYPAIGKSFDEGTNIRIQISHSFSKPIRVFHIEVKSKLKLFESSYKVEQSISLNDRIETNESKEYFVAFSNSKLKDYKVILNRDVEHDFSLE